MKCPSCGGLAELDEKSCSCGWRAKGKNPFKPERIDKQCIWKTDGYQCQNDGHLSNSTLGAGPWYCRVHFAKLMSWASWEASVVDESMIADDNRVSKLDSREAGESDHEWSMRCKTWVLAKVKRGLLRGPERQPGEDMEEAA